MSKVVGYMCFMSNVYTYQGWTFEIHPWCGPWPHRKDGELRKRAGDKFWHVWETFNKLSDAEKAACRVAESECVPLVENTQEGTGG